MKGLSSKIKIFSNHVASLFQKTVEDSQTNAAPSVEFEGVKNKWLARYSTFIRRRFNVFSRGGGDWAMLSVGTAAARAHARRLKKGTAPKKRNKNGKTPKRDRKHSILRDTGLLFNSLSIGAYGNFTKHIPRGVEFGFESVPHAASGTKPGKGVVSIAAIAGFHQKGGKNLPRRRILVKCPPDVAESMRQDLTRQYRKSFTELKRRSKN